MHMRPEAGAPVLARRDRCMSRREREYDSLGCTGMAYLPFRQKDLDRLHSSKTTVRRVVRELPLANIRLCGAKITLPGVCKVHGCRLHQVTA